MLLFDILHTHKLNGWLLNTQTTQMCDDICCEWK